MFKLPLMLLLDREAFWKTLREHGISWAGIASMVAFVIIACAIYGVVMAGWRSSEQALYATIKLPLVFIASTAIVAVFNWMVATAFGSGLSFRESVALTFASMAVACWILLALAPVVWFFSLTGVSKVGEAPTAEINFAYRVILLTHVIVLAIAGVAGNISLFNGLRAVVRPNCPTALLFVAWITLFAIVGCQVAWMLSPFVGDPLLEVTFFSPDALKTNFLEVVFGRLLPSFLTGADLWSR